MVCGTGGSAYPNRACMRGPKAVTPYRSTRRPEKTAHACAVSAKKATKKLALNVISPICAGLQSLRQQSLIGAGKSQQPLLFSTNKPPTMSGFAEILLLPNLHQPVIPPHGRER